MPGTGTDPALGAISSRVRRDFGAAGGKRKVGRGGHRPLGEQRRKLGAGAGGAVVSRRPVRRPRRRAGLSLQLARTPAGRAVDGAAELRRRPVAKEKGGGGGADGTGHRLPAVTLCSPAQAWARAGGGGGGVERRQHG